MCPVCHQRGLESLEEAIAHCKRAAEVEEGERQSGTRKDTTQEAIDGLKALKENRGEPLLDFKWTSNEWTNDRCGKLEKKRRRKQ